MGEFGWPSGFHHIFPKNHLSSKENISEKTQQFMLANFAFLSQKDNRSIQDKAPSDYVELMPPGSLDSIFEASFIPKQGLDMNYAEFTEARSKLLAEKANELLRLAP